MLSGKKIKITLMFCALLAMTSCDQMPSLNVFGPNYRPMTSDVAEMAAPLDPQAEKGERPVLCRVWGGAAQFETGIKDFSTADFAVWPKGRTNVTLTASGFFAHGTFVFQAYFDDEGQKMIFCPMTEGPLNKKIACSSIYALDDDYDDGIKRTFDIPQAVQGGEITCAHSKSAFRK